MKKPEQPPTLASLMPDLQDQLQKAIKSPEVLSISRRCELEYWPWQKLKYVAAAKKIDARAVWLLARLSREARYKILPLRGDKSSLKFNTPDYLQFELMNIDQQLAGGLTTQDENPPTASQRERFIISALREEAIASSMLEGAVTTRQEAKQMLKTGRRPRNRGEQMVLNNYQAIQFIREHRHDGLSPEFLLELQKILTDKTLDDPTQVGRFRTPKDKIQVVDDRDNEIMHVPPPASELKSRLEALCGFGNLQPRGRDFIHPVVAACVLHFQVGFDHPFCDGNGRTARYLLLDDAPQRILDV